jgi:hypothetical protein
MKPPEPQPDEIALRAWLLQRRLLEIRRRLEQLEAERQRDRERQARERPQR